MDSRQTPTVYEHGPAGSDFFHAHHRYSYHPYHHAVSTRQSQSQSQSPPLSMPIKGKRKRASPQQLEVLNKVFVSTSFPSTEMRNRLARDLSMTPRTVQIWFQNKRQASRQRDGHHSRNTKSMAASTACVNSFERQYSKSQSPSNSDNGSSLTQSPSPAVGSGARSSRSPQQQQLMVLVEAATAVRPGPAFSMPSPAQSVSPAACWSTPSEAYMYKHKFKLGNVTASGQNVEYAHTRNDQWFTEDTPARLDYLYGHGAQTQIMSPPSRTSRLPSMAQMTTSAKDATAPSLSAYRTLPPMYPKNTQGAGPRARVSTGMCLPPLSPAAPASQGPRTVPVQRSMSLMDMLNAPPEQRKLPPLPPIAP
ncbi:Short stature homeobox protein 2 [Coemansia sp. RSA 1591]|nr:Short stature homeobox protein 2 [Coemansia sp. RSA 1591]KAJ2181751.1 Short stature homeobox protein 2 [Coemansia sp. RSA 551]KAJ2192713.1 Short stature homeobox protein 2 [Coemansia sp. RSA 522]KAJ2272538.1 Short stature homeobox protein 2 [Coemansia sp. RSA 370]KAJ2728142.1 Short stature homeobox protein 2 [Coemansia sp. D1744]